MLPTLADDLPVGPGWVFELNTDPKGTRGYFGAVHLGVYDGRVLVYAGRAGSGRDDEDLVDVRRRLRELDVADCPFGCGRAPRAREHHWVRPELVREVRFTEWTADGLVRHPVYLGFCKDRRPEDVRRE